METGRFCKAVVIAGVLTFTGANMAEQFRCWQWSTLGPCEEIKSHPHLIATAGNTIAMNVLLPSA
jgi:hypothetical protein